VHTRSSAPSGTSRFPGARVGCGCAGGVPFGQPGQLLCSDRSAWSLPGRRRSRGSVSTCRACAKTGSPDGCRPTNCDRRGAGSATAVAELKACTPASLSPSNGVTGEFGPRQKSSSSGRRPHATRRHPNPHGRRHRRLRHPTYDTGSYRRHENDARQREHWALQRSSEATTTPAHRDHRGPGRSTERSPIRRWPPLSKRRRGHECRPPGQDDRDRRDGRERPRP
jgi:hypothetical protein